MVENGCRQMGNTNFWLFRFMDIWESGLTICPMSTVSVYAVNTVYGQVGKPFYHLSELFAESGQMGKLVFNLFDLYFQVSSKFHEIV